MVTTETTTTAGVVTATTAIPASTETAPARVARHLVASAIVCDPHPVDGRPRVLLVWSDSYGAWVFPTAHPTCGESLPQTALRAATTIGVDAYLLRDTTPEPVPGLVAIDSPWRTYQIPAPTGPGTGPGQPSRPWHQHLDHLFIALADSTTPDDSPALRNARWYPVADLPTFTRPDIPALAAAAMHHATATVYRPYQRSQHLPGRHGYPQDHRGRTHR